MIGKFKLKDFSMIDNFTREVNKSNEKYNENLIREN